MIRKAWRTPKGDWVLELCEDRGRGVMRAIPRFGYQGRDDFGQIWLADEADVSGEAWIPAGFYVCDKRGFRLTPWPGRAKLDCLRLMRQVPKRHMNEMHSWLRPILENVARCRKSGAALVWETLIHA